MARYLQHLLHSLREKTGVEMFITHFPLCYIGTGFSVSQTVFIFINTYYKLKGLLKARRPPKVSNEMKCTDEKMTWNTQDTNMSSYVSKANVDHTTSGQGTGISTLDHSATTPRVMGITHWDWWDFPDLTDIHTVHWHHSCCIIFGNKCDWKEFLLHGESNSQPWH